MIEVIHLNNTRLRIKATSGRVKLTLESEEKIPFRVVEHYLSVDDSNPQAANCEGGLHCLVILAAADPTAEEWTYEFDIPAHCRVKDWEFRQGMVLLKPQGGYSALRLGGGGGTVVLTNGSSGEMPIDLGGGKDAGSEPIVLPSTDSGSSESSDGTPVVTNPPPEREKPIDIDQLPSRED